MTEIAINTGHYQTHHGLDIRSLAEAFSCILGSELKSDIDTTLNLCSFNEKTKDADIVLIGVRKLNKQSFQDKNIDGLLSNSPKKAKIIFFSESADTEAISQAREKGISGIYETSEENLKLTCSTFIRDYKLE